MRRYRKQILAIIAMLLTHVSVQSQEVSLYPDVKYQTMHSFGASDAWRTQFVGENWPIDKRERIADLLFSKDFDSDGNPIGIGLSLWRFYIGAGSMEQGDSSNIKNNWRRAESFLQPDGKYNWGKQSGQQWFLKAAHKRGVERFLAFTIAAPVQYAVNDKAYSIKEDQRINLKPGHYDDYAVFLADILEHFEKEAMGFDYLSPINEPQWDWSKASQEGTAATNEDIYLLVKYLSKELESRQLNTSIVVSEAADINFIYNEYNSSGNQADVFFGDDSALKLSHLPKVKNTISGHSYFTTWPIAKQLETRNNLREKLDQLDSLDYWQTEFCILEESSEIGNGNSRDLEMGTALYVARVIHSDLTIANASSWQWWTALTTFDYKDGLIYLDTGDESDLFNRDKMVYDGEIKESKLLWAFGNFSRFVRPGMVRVEATIRDNDMVNIAAFTEGRECVIVLINYSEETEKLSISSDIEISSAYLTDENNDLGSYNLKGKVIKLPRRSVTTVIGKFRK
jgi:O-glycosyl hydrolase